ncbi:Unknown protein sequence [Pseudomonas syringae pv. cilantro]|uniref:Uncharacterized protein n=1 Tax=Pseudomonas syringae pv. cilantro TaxID=81035 RepID=A0A0N1JPM5_PSESX|nr:Unknown protein sequence [Pseudomonas syringae pv. cilantro]
MHREGKYGREAFAVTDRAMLRSHKEKVRALLWERTCSRKGRYIR